MGDSMRGSGSVAGARRTIAAASSAAAFGLIALALVGTAMGAPTSGADAPRLIKSYNWLRTTCVPAPSNTVRAQVTVRMKVVNYDGLGDWAQYMKVKARLIPTSAGLNYTRPWKEVKTPYLTQNKTHTYTMRVLTDNVSAASDWQVQLKLTWDRPAMRDVVVDRTGPFGCGLQGGS